MPAQSFPIGEVARRTGLPVSYILLQTDATPDHWREVLAAADSADAGDGSLWAQIAARPFGMLISLGTNHPFLKRPSYVEVADLPVAERAAAMSDPARRARILAEDDLPPDPSIAFDGIGGFLAAVLDKLFPLGDTPDYEPTPDRAVTALAEGVPLVAGLVPSGWISGSKNFPAPSGKTLRWTAFISFSSLTTRPSTLASWACAAGTAAMIAAAVRKYRNFISALPANKLDLRPLRVAPTRINYN